MGHFEHFWALSLLWRWSFSQSPGIRGQVWAERANYQRLGLETSYLSLHLLLLVKHWEAVHRSSGVVVCSWGHRETWPLQGEHPGFTGKAHPWEPWNSPS